MNCYKLVEILIRHVSAGWAELSRLLFSWSFRHSCSTMSFLPNFTASFPGERPQFIPPYSQFNLRSRPPISSRPTFRISPPFQDTFRVSRIGVGRSSRYSRKRSVCMTLINERLGRDRDIADPSSILAYELVQGKLVKWSSMVVLNRSIPEPPTAVLLHGILGSRKNWGSFVRRLSQEFPTWQFGVELLDPYMWSNHGVGVSFLAVQFVLVDLRCHGDSASIKKRGPHTVASTALDVLKLVRVVLSMVEQAAKPLPRPVRAWVLDATPGKVRAGQDGEDHPGKLISFLRKLPKEVSLYDLIMQILFVKPLQIEFSKLATILRQVSSKRDIVNALIQEGFSKDVAQVLRLTQGTFDQWVVTNLRPTGASSSSSSSFSWVFDLEGISEMYESYEETNLWKVVENLPRGVHVNFLKAERSLHRWALEDLQRIHAAEESAADEGGGVEMHVLEDAGHWVHADNPDGLFRILSFSFKGVKA
ncbi:protein ABHD11 isoform X1 [Gossypium australe]|uniref:Protein ABHD11 isoform X1 n=6 Tax=Gossypium TaxID=3633 RepID=A0A5B6X2D5_9ROSI|nr:protein ABHD11 isoform X1 [Gossypium australe]